MSIINIGSIPECKNTDSLNPFLKTSKNMCFLNDGLLTYIFLLRNQFSASSVSWLFLGAKFNSDWAVAVFQPS